MVREEFEGLTELCQLLRRNGGWEHRDTLATVVASATARQPVS